MTLLRLTLSLAIVGSCGAAMAEQITCESHGSRADACGTVQPGSTVRLVQQLSRSPCIEGSSWGANDDSIWVSNGCRAVFDVQPPYDASADRRNDRHYDRRDRDSQQQQYSERDDDQRNDNYDRSDQQDRSDDRDRGDDRQDRHSGRGEQRRDQARQACAYQASADRSFGPEEVQTNDIRWIGGGRLSLNLDTPDGPLTCIVDRDGNVTLNEDR